MRDIRNHQFYLDKTLRYICGALYLEAFSAFQEVSSKCTGISITAFDRMNLNDKDIIDSSVFSTGHVLLYFSSTPSPFSIACRQYHAGAWLPVLRWGSWLDGEDYQPWGRTADCQPLDFPSSQPPFSHAVRNDGNL